MSEQDIQRSLSSELASIGAMSLEDLRAAWRAKLGTAPPRLRSIDLLARALAQELQIRALGDLPAPLRRRASDLARRFAEDPAFRPVAGPALKPGSSLIREWRGERHEIRVMEDGFSYRGEPIRSLSEAALKITGTKWNGLIFFGLKERPSARARR